MEEKWGEEPQAAMLVQGQLQGRHDHTRVLLSLVYLWLGTSLRVQPPETREQTPGAAAGGP